MIFAIGWARVEGIDHLEAGAQRIENVSKNDCVLIALAWALTAGIHIPPIGGKVLPQVFGGR